MVALLAPVLLDEYAVYNFISMIKESRLCTDIMKKTLKKLVLN